MPDETYRIAVLGMRRLVKRGHCVCCGLYTDDFVAIGEGVKMCRVYCVDPPRRDHRVYAEQILRMLTDPDIKG